MLAYPWISNDVKFQRALGVLGADASEAELKAKYIEYGGLVLGEPEVSPAKEEVAEEPKEAPKKKAKK